MASTAPLRRQDGEPMARSAREAAPDAAFAEFVSARQAHLLRFGRALTGSQEAAADLVQDALERTLLHWRSLRTGDPEGYVRRAMVNRNISIWRKFGREHPSERLPEPPYTEADPDPDLWAAVRRLSPRQRTVIALRYLEDLTEVQTAELMGCSVGTVKSQHHAALATLRTLIAEEES